MAIIIFIYLKSFDCTFSCLEPLTWILTILNTRETSARKAPLPTGKSQGGQPCNLLARTAFSWTQQVWFSYHFSVIIAITLLLCNLFKFILRWFFFSFVYMSSYLTQPQSMSFRQKGRWHDTDYLTHWVAFYQENELKTAFPISLPLAEKKQSNFPSSNTVYWHQ